MPVPLSTYRLQLHAGFNFDAAAAIADYLEALGVSHAYFSPYLQSASGSTHGYDVVRHDTPNPELGGPEGHARLCARLGECHLGQVLDIVPNHMSIAGQENAWWWDVLENGQSSRYAAYFDVDWRPPEEKLHDTVLLPVLGNHYGRVLEAGEIHIVREGGAFLVCYHDHRAPVAPRSLNELLRRASVRAASDKLAFLADSFGNLPLSTATDNASVMRRHRDKELLREMLARLCEDEPAIAQAIEETLAEINASADELDSLLTRQNYRLAFWRSAQHDLDYRRFFDINTLVSLRMEDERVFEDTHRLVLKWVAQGVIDGLRIDHPDGLRDPKEYLDRVRRGAPDAWVVVEKILEPGERLPDDWPVAGTTGYDFLNQLGGLYVDSEGEAPISDFYHEFTGESTDYLAVVHKKKLFVLRELFGSDLNRAASFMVNVCERQRRYRDYSRRELHAMIAEVIACFPVYRTYVRASQGAVSADDARFIDQAINTAKANRPDIDQDLFDFMRDLLLLKVTGAVESQLVMRFEQSTGPVMAKGVEDTTFYNFNRLVALNEVGGDPGHFGYSPDEFHAYCLAIQERWPETMSSTTTHDTKRSEDVRARIALLSEMPRDWKAAVKRWSRINKQHKLDGLPDRNAEYLFYETLVGAWPIDSGRAVAYMHKATREAKAHTSWTQPQPTYEAALEQFVRAALADQEFVKSLEEFVEPLVAAGRINSLSMALVKLTAPGVPDVYQGNELWDLSLVDPDNRRPVDFERRRELLAELASLSPAEIMARMDEGLPKLFVTTQTLHLRKRVPQAFGREGRYTPLTVEGPRAANAIAFQRGDECVTIAPRLVLALRGGWGATRAALPDGKWWNEFTGHSHSGGQARLGELLREFPVALLSPAIPE